MAGQLQVSYMRAQGPAIHARSCDDLTVFPMLAVTLSFGLAHCYSQLTFLHAGGGQHLLHQPLLVNPRPQIEAEHHALAIHCCQHLIEPTQWHTITS
jgi:hypothetical protein